MGINPLYVLFIEDDPDHILQMQEMVADVCSMPVCPYRIRLINVESVQKAKEFLRDNENIDLILLDLSLPDSRGLPTFEKLNDEIYQIPTIILTGLDDNLAVEYTLQKGAQDYLVKGNFNGDMLLRSIRYSIERHKLISDLIEFSLVDELTGLYNRRGFMTLAESHLMLSRRKEKNKGDILFFFDLDKMKEINDQFGHKEGDAALRASAAILKGTFRSSDILGRLGGDEFVALTFDADKIDIDALAKRFENNVKAYNEKKTSRFRVSMSYGTSYIAHDDKISIGEVMQEADGKMYRHKKEKQGSRNERLS